MGNLKEISLGAFQFDAKALQLHKQSPLHPCMILKNFCYKKQTANTFTPTSERLKNAINLLWQNLESNNFNQYE